MRIWAIPDIHGRMDLLKRLMALLMVPERLGKDDKIIFLADYVDRGPDSKGVLEYLRAFQQSVPDRVICLFGNHERLMVNALEGKQFGIWMMNGGRETLKSFGVDPDASGEHAFALFQKMKEDNKDLFEWVRNLPLFHREHGFFFSHAPAPTEKRRNKIRKATSYLLGFPEVTTEPDAPFTEEELTWTYSPDEPGIARFHGQEEDGKMIIGVCGHVHALQDQLQNGKPLAPRMYDHYLYLDAGCGCHPKAPLIACEVNSREVVSVFPEEKK